MAALPTQDEVLGYFASLSNWGRWGPQDDLGTINHITAEARVRAAGLIRTGELVSCAWDIDPNQPEDHDLEQGGNPVRLMLGSGEGLKDQHRIGGDDQARMNSTAEYLGLVFHGFRMTHLDALSHISWDGKMYNDRPAELVGSRSGATVYDVRGLGDGIVSRGILLDVARHRGVDWLEAGEGVQPEEIDQMLATADLVPWPGDVLLLRTGYGRKRTDRGPGRPQVDGRQGWHVSCMPWLHEHRVALIGADTAQDVVPSGYESPLGSPVHAVAITALGMPLIDNCNLENLAEACNRMSRWAFFFSLAPLRVTGGTGSPVNPLAIF